MFYDFLLIFLPLFVVVDPAGTLPLYISLTEPYNEERRRAIARKATLVAAIVGILFIILGQALLAFLGIQFADFQIAGGILLVVLSIVDLLSTGKPAVSEQLLREQQQDDPVSVVPLAIPLIVGPATLTTSLLLINTYTERYSRLAPDGFGPRWGPVIVVTMVCVALLMNLLILYAAMWSSRFIVRLLGKQTMAVINKIMMILLAAIAISLIRRGITTIVQGLK